MTQTNGTLPSRWSDWESLEYLGGGSFGAVYKIHRNISGTNEYAAMKIIPVPKETAEARNLLDSGYDLHSINQRYKEDLDAIRQEYGLMAQLKGNANVVYCDDICEEPNPDGIGWTLYIRMELLTPLMKALAEPYGESQAVKLGMDLCNALAACKRKKIIHRDIKPGNIMVSEDGNYKLGDFGVAKKMEGTSGGTKTGTYNFMAPEVYNNQPYGQSADIYSLGMVLYWMLNLRCGPFLPLPPTVPNASQIENARDRRFGGEPLPPPANGSQELKRIVLRACAFDPADRYSDPEAFYADLAQYARTHQEDPEYYEPFPVISPKSKESDNIWDDDPDGDTMGGGTIDDETSGGGERLGQLDVRRELKVTARELTSGCVKSVTTGTKKRVNVTIAPGSKEGVVLHQIGAGKEDPATGAKGDLYLTLKLLKEKPVDFFGEAPIDAEATISVKQAKEGCQYSVVADGKNYSLKIPAGVSDGQVIKIDAAAPGESSKKLTVRICITENPVKEKKEESSGGCLLTSWILIGIALVFALPPVGIGMLVLASPFLFLGKKK